MNRVREQEKKKIKNSFIIVPLYLHLHFFYLAKSLTNVEHHYKCEKLSNKLTAAWGLMTPQLCHDWPDHRWQQSHDPPSQFFVLITGKATFM